jgi:hypothetical protein
VAKGMFDNSHPASVQYSPNARYSAPSNKDNLQFDLA